MFFIMFMAFFGLCFGVNGMTSEQIINQSKFLSLDGNYSGSEDEFLSFDGNGDFFSETFRSFTLTITNETTANQEIHLFPTYNPKHTALKYTKTTLNSIGLECDAIGDAATKINFNAKAIDVLVDMIGKALTPTFTMPDGLFVNDGVIYTDIADGKQVICQGAPSKIENLMAYLQLHPTLLTSMKLKTTDSSQFAQNIKFTSLCPFKENAVQPISLTRYITNKDQIETLIDIPVNLTIGDTSDMSINVKAGSTLDITLFFGATFSSTSYLEKAVKKAKTAVLLNGADRMVVNSNLKQLG